MSERAWISQIFDAVQAGGGGIVRRHVADVQRYASEEELLESVKERGFHLVRGGGQYIIICDSSGDFKLLC